MTRIQLQALVKLYDNGPGTLGKVGINRTMADKLVYMGFAEARLRGTPTTVGKRSMVYAMTVLGRREVILSGKRFGEKMAGFSQKQGSRS
jgi:hypothetical protein